MELRRTNIKQKDDIPELTSGSLEEFIQEGRVTHWMPLCVGALKEFLDKVVVGGQSHLSSCVAIVNHACAYANPSN